MIQQPSLVYIIRPIFHINFHYLHNIGLGLVNDFVLFREYRL